ncbi:MAG TPA: hypothetical protein VMM12_02785 [Longimicrobiales bacterium]|nr:hypothetical protein [Longimicrobiales bacterium]
MTRTSAHDHRPTALLRSRLLLLLLLAAAGIGGCASARRSDEGAVYLIVDNRRPVMVTIYAVRYSSRFRLGTVNGMGQERFVIRSHMMGGGGELQLAVDPLGDPSRRYTRVVLVRPGETLHLELVF